VVSPVFSVQRVEWATAHETLRAIRAAVFIVEQRVPPELEWDDTDANCVHVVAVASDGQSIGTGRLLTDGHIGRMAVLRPWRGRGVGAALLRELLAAARDNGHESIELSAQTHAIGFYERFGFAAVGPEYLEAGIPHRKMIGAIERPHPLPFRR
jgi:predicted GNAT family N-acyltransferase